MSLRLPSGTVILNRSRSLPPWFLYSLQLECPTMNRKRVVFPAKQAVELQDEPLREMQPYEFVIETTRSLISSGTEMTVFNRTFEPGTHWDGWVKYPFHPGYLTVGRIIKLGA